MLNQDSPMRSNDGVVRKVTRATALETMLVEYRDGEGKETTRIVFKVPEAKTCFILQGSIDGTFVATAANQWFIDSLADLQKANKEAESI